MPTMKPIKIAIGDNGSNSHLHFETFLLPIGPNYSVIPKLFRFFDRFRSSRIVGGVFPMLRRWTKSLALFAIPIIERVQISIILQFLRMYFDVCYLAAKWTRT
jgi:hypothetical protein